jgi:hypothetical protein
MHGCLIGGLARRVDIIEIVDGDGQGLARARLSEGHRLVGALASLSEQSGSSAKRTIT